MSIVVIYSAIANLAFYSLVQSVAVAGQDVPPNRQTRSEPTDTNKDDDIVVVGRRPPTPLDDATPTRQLSEDQISTYGALSVGDLIQKLRDEQGGRPFSIVVNGRRVSSIAEINELPAEALNSIQLYAPTEAGKFGFAPTDRLLNVTLKRRFRSLLADVSGEGPTDGGGGSIQEALRSANIAGDSRQNGVLNVKAGGGLLARQRPHLASDPSVDPDRSLLPRSRAVEATLGTSRPLGNGSLDIGLAGNLARTVSQQTGTIRQSDDSRTARFSTGYNLTTGSLSGFASVNLNAVNSRSRITGLCATGAQPCTLQDLDTGTLTAALVGSLGAGSCPCRQAIYAST